jgi:hypothetical protein
MSNWITITIADLYNSQAAALIDAANSVSLSVNKPGQADQVSRVPGIIADVTMEIRRRVARCNQLDQVVTAIPSGLKPLAVDIIFCRLKVAMQMALSEDERATLKQRERQLDRIADGSDMVDPPDTAIVANFNQTQPSPTFGKRHLFFTRCTQDG